MRITNGDGGVLVEAEAYRLHVDPKEPIAHLTDGEGGSPMRLSLLAALDTDGGLDGTLAHGPARVEEREGGGTIDFEVRSTVWDAKRVRLDCSEREVAFQVTVSGHGRLTAARLLGGWYSGNPRWGGGTFHSRWAAHTLFDPSPDDPKRILQPASEPATIGVVGGSQPGRGHWFFTPAPMLFAGSAADVTDPGDPAAAPWTTFELRSDVAAANFSEVRYAPFLGGFSFELGYEGETSVGGSFATPRLVIRVGSANPYEAVREHGERLRADGAAPTVERRRPEWWTRPIVAPSGPPTPG